MFLNISNSRSYCAFAFLRVSLTQSVTMFKIHPNSMTSTKEVDGCECSTQKASCRSAINNALSTFVCHYGSPRDSCSVMSRERLQLLTSWRYLPLLLTPYQSSFKNAHYIFTHYSLKDPEHNSWDFGSGPDLIEWVSANPACCEYRLSLISL